MPPLPSLGKTLIVAGLILAGIGVLLTVGHQFGLGRLPGDFHFRKGNFQIYFPLATSLLISLILSALFWLFRR